MKKKQVFTILMVAVILLVAAAGVWIVGSVKGWFDRTDGDTAAVSQVKGIVTMYRDGFAHTPGDGTLLRSGDRLAAATGAPPETPAPSAKTLTCSLTIRCDTILSNMDALSPGKAGYVPSDGVILPAVQVEFTEGETVFDVLTRVCSSTGIPIEYSWSPMFSTYYVEGINGLYEFDCGSESGWMFKVNGWFPNYGCSAYTLEDGDSIVWCYSCSGYGADVGAPAW